MRPDLSVAASLPEPPAPEPPPTVIPAPAISPPDAPPPAGARPLAGWSPSATAPAPGETAAVAADAAGWGAAAPAPPARIPLWRRVPLGWILVGGFVIVGAVGGLIFNASRSPSGEISKAGNLDVADLRVGDCFDLKDPAADEIGEVTALPCTSEHEYELYYVGSMAPGDFPTQDGFGAWLDDNCIPAFETYVGTAYDASDLEIFWLQPTSAAWKDGDRSIQCSVYHPRIHRLTESLKGSAR